MVEIFRACLPRAGKTALRMTDSLGSGQKKSRDHFGPGFLFSHSRKLRKDCVTGAWTETEQAVGLVAEIEAEPETVVAETEAEPVAETEAELEALSPVHPEFRVLAVAWPE
jgi:hypothetical protein